MADDPERCTVRVRRATAEDSAELARLNAAFNEVDEPAEVLVARLTDPRQVEIALIAECGTRGVGFAGLRVTPSLFCAAPSAELTELYVEPVFRRQGIARRLIALAAQLARARGAEELRVLTGYDNHAARALYRATGFEDDDLAMVRKL